MVPFVIQVEKDMDGELVPGGDGWVDEIDLNNRE